VPKTETVREVLMEYFTLQGSCLLSILIPIHFAIGDYIKFCKENGFNRFIGEVALLFLGGIVATIFILEKKDPYISVTWLGGIIVAILQNEFIFRKIRKTTGEIKITDKIVGIINIIEGIVLIVLPHLSVFVEWILKGTEYSVQASCLVIYTLWGIEEALFGTYQLGAISGIKNY